MTGPDNHKQLIALAAKARALARSRTDPITVDILTHDAEECEEQAAQLKLTRPDGRH
jgi:hypothetical protein